MLWNVRASASTFSPSSGNSSFQPEVPIGTAAVADQAAFDALYPSPITDANLQQITSANTTITTGKRGWYLDLNVGAGWNGEKVLAEARTFQSSVFFTTYAPVTQGSEDDVCGQKFGLNKL